MQAFVQTLRDIARHELDQRSGAALGIVTSVQGGPDDHSCTVALRESGVVLPKVPIAVGWLGFANLPIVDDLVIVLFLNGDLHAPVVAGRLYTHALKPPEHAPGELVAQLPVGAEAKERINLKVATPGDGTRAITLLLDGEVPVAVRIDDAGIVLETKDAKVALSQSNASDAKLSVAVGEAKMSFDQGGDIAIETSGKLTLKGANVEISGDASVKVAGQTIDLN